MKKSIFLILFILVITTLLSCNNNKSTAKKLLKDSNEEELKLLLENLSYDIYTEEIFDWYENEEDYLLSSIFFDDIDNIAKHHQKFHASKFGTEEWEKWMYFYNHSEIKNASDFVTQCPYCAYIEEQYNKNSSYTIPDKFDFRMFKYFKENIYPAYQKAKASKLAELEKKKLPDNWKDCRLQGFTYNYSWASRGYYIPSSK